MASIETKDILTYLCTIGSVWLGAWMAQKWKERDKRKDDADTVATTREQTRTADTQMAAKLFLERLLTVEENERSCHQRLSEIEAKLDQTEAKLTTANEKIENLEIENRQLKRQVADLLNNQGKAP